ncbi:MAG: hypothetical protein E7257_03505 [Lachnospiraceae bacterium]|nr:hypothetical protein [Lachnospiraceae bacterium]MBE5953211.1 hypothetical protein [Lachnospiraceae bacterium]
MALKISYTELTALTGQMEKAAENIMTVYDSMLTAVNSLVENGYMEAESANSYVDNFTSLIGPSITELNSLVVSFYTQLNTICDNFADVDAQIAAKIRA